MSDELERLRRENRRLQQENDALRQEGGGRALPGWAGEPFDPVVQAAIAYAARKQGGGKGG